LPKTTLYQVLAVAKGKAKRKRACDGVNDIDSNAGGYCIVLSSHGDVSDGRHSIAVGFGSLHSSLPWFDVRKSCSYELSRFQSLGKLFQERWFWSVAMRVRIHLITFYPLTQSPCHALNPSLLHPNNRSLFGWGLRNDCGGCFGLQL